MSTEQTPEPAPDAALQSAAQRMVTNPQYNNKPLPVTA
jgi:hypothetical protein